MTLPVVRTNDPTNLAPLRLSFYSLIERYQKTLHLCTLTLRILLPASLNNPCTAWNGALPSLAFNGAKV